MKKATEKPVSDWERELCELVDKIVEDPINKYRLTEQLVDHVEDLVMSAYLRGKKNVEKSNSRKD